MPKPRFGYDEAPQTGRKSIRRRRKKKTTSDFSNLEPDVWGEGPNAAIANTPVSIGVKKPKRKPRRKRLTEKSNQRLKLPTSEKTRKLYKIIAVR